MHTRFLEATEEEEEKTYAFYSYGTRNTHVIKSVERQ